MAAPAGTFQTYQAKGIREDLINDITNISPDKTPVLSMTGSTRAYSTLHEWQTDVLANPAANAHIEGDTASATAITPTVRLGNYTQILKKVFIVSRTQDEVNKAGRGKELSYQELNKKRELATDVEYAFVVNSNTAVGASATARQLKGINGWITTNVSTASAGRALTSAVLDAELQDVWAAGGDPDMILTGGAQKRAFQNTTNFPGLTKNVNASEKKYLTAVSIYESPFGMMRVQLSHVMNSTLSSSGTAKIFMIETSKWRKAWLSPPKPVEMAKIADGTMMQIVTEVTLESLNEKASGAINNLTNPS